MVFFFFFLPAMPHDMWDAGSQFPNPGIKPVSPALELRVLTTGLPGKSEECRFFRQVKVNVEKSGE